MGKRGLILILIACFTVLATPAGAQQNSNSQKPIWTSKPDSAAFEKIENDHLAAAQKLLDQMLAVKGARSVENTLS